MTELKKCPFCGGNGRLSFKDYRFGGQNFRGEKKISYRIQVICSKCHSRGKPVVTEMLINPNPYRTSFYLAHTKSRHFCSLMNNDIVAKEDKTFEPYVNDAIEAWNRRAEEQKTQKHGRWDADSDGYWNGELVYDHWFCSECGWDDGVSLEERPNYKFCPNCGARMDEVSE